MFRQLLARLIPKRRPFRIQAMQTIEGSTYEPPCDSILSEAYHAHAAIHGRNKLLPVDAIPPPPERPRISAARGGSELT